MPSMFDAARTKNALAPKFRVDKEDWVVKEGIAQVKSVRYCFYSRVHDNADWQLEYTKIFPVNYPGTDYKIRVIEEIIKENFFNFRLGVFQDVVMFSRDNIVFKNPELIYEDKVVEGELVNKELKNYLPLSDKMSYDIIDNKGGLKFYRKDDLVIMGKFIYYNGEVQPSFLNDTNIRVPADIGEEFKSRGIYVNNVYIGGKKY